MDRTPRWIPVFVAMVVLASSGCRSLGTPTGTDVDLDQQTPLQVDVGGLVTKPQSLTIGPEGLTLLQALTRVGGIEKVPASFLSAGRTNERLVRLQRRSRAIVPTNFYFPETFVMTGMGGNVPLRGGDLVQVMEIRDTSLGFDQSVPAGQTFTVAGNVGRPGIYKAKVGARFSEVTTKAGMLDSTHLVLTRGAVGGLGSETFFIPLADSAFQNTLQNTRVLEGDTYLFQEFKSHPIVLTSLVEPLLRKRSPQTSKAPQTLAERMFSRIPPAYRR